MLTPIRLLILCFLCVILAACTFPNTASSNQADKVEASKIIDAIGRYYTDHGEFPTQLNVLVPTYLPALPKTTRNNDFAYRTFHDSDRGNDYELCFLGGPKRDASEYGCCYMHVFDNPPYYDGWDCTAGDG